MLEFKQRSALWFAERCGKLTASRVADVSRRTAKLASGKGWKADRGRYLDQLVAERLTGQAASHFVSAEMQWGIDNEPRARADYEFLFNRSATQIGFAPHPTIAMAGASPDGLIGEDGLVEFKCPKTETHLATWLSGAVPAEYLAQVQWQMACCPGRTWCDFVSYDPRVRVADLQLFRVQVPRDDDHIAELEEDAKAFLAEVDERVEQLMRLCRREAA